MARKFLCVYYDQEEAWTQLGDGEAGRLLKALIAYAKRGEEPALTGAERSAWAFLKVQVDANNDSYDAKVSKCREAGKASAAKRQQVSTDVNERQQTSTNKNNNDIGSKGRFAPPTLEEVRTYCQERMNTVDPERFFDYYTSNGWKVGKNPMKDWKAAVRSWEGSNSVIQKSAKSSDSLEGQYEMMRRWAIENE